MEFSELEFGARPRAELNRYLAPHEEDFRGVGGTNQTPDHSPDSRYPTAWNPPESADLEGFYVNCTNILDVKKMVKIGVRNEWIHKSLDDVLRLNRPDIDWRGMTICRMVNRTTGRTMVGSHGLAFPASYNFEPDLDTRRSVYDLNITPNEQLFANDYNSANEDMVANEYRMRAEQDSQMDVGTQEWAKHKAGVRRPNTDALSFNDFRAPLAPEQAPGFSQPGYLLRVKQKPALQQGEIRWFPAEQVYRPQSADDKCARCGSDRRGHSGPYAGRIVCDHGFEEQEAAAAPGFSQPTPLFGAPAPAQQHGFGGGPLFEPPSRLFGAPAPAQHALFGAPGPFERSGLFGAPAPAAPHALFGTPDPVQQGGLFNPPAPAAQHSLFGGQEPAKRGGLFNPPAPAAQHSLFGGQDPAQQGGLFGGQDPARQRGFGGGSLPPVQGGGGLFGAAPAHTGGPPGFNAPRNAPSYAPGTQLYKDGTPNYFPKVNWRTTCKIDGQTTGNYTDRGRLSAGINDGHVKTR